MLKLLLRRDRGADGGRGADGAAPGAAARPRGRRAATIACALLVAGFALLNASRGIAWSRAFHPDEAKIARWMRQAREKGYVAERVYPGGFFVLSAFVDALERPCRGLAKLWTESAGQDGRVVATDAASFGAAGGEPPPPPNDIQRTRNLNVALFSLAALFVFLAGLELGAGPAASAAAALLFSVQPLPLEHAHYCETDLAMLFSLSLATWLALRALRLGSAAWYLGASFAAGFAVACKYSLAPLALWAPALAAALARGRGGPRPGAAFARLAAGGAAAMAAGFLAGTPALLLAPGFFLGDAGRAARATWSEADRALGAHRSYWASCAWRAASLLREAPRSGFAALALYAAGAAFWFRRENRRLLAAVPLFLAAYALHAVFTMPWIRGQELLPLLPGLCLGVAAALAWAGRSLRRGTPRRRLVAAAALLALFGAGFLQSRTAGERVLSCFRRRDTRAECQNWLVAAARPGLILGTEPYVAQTVRGTGCRGTPRRLVADTWPAWADDPSNGVPYLVRNASFSGRRKTVSGAEEGRRRFAAECTPLAAWRLAPGGARTVTFAQPDVELWALPAPADDPAAPDVPICCDRPAFFAPGPRPLYAPDEPSPGVGPVRAVATVGARHEVRPPASGGACWAVAQAVAGPVAGSVAWDGLFRPRRASLSPAGAAAFRLDGAAFRRAAACDVRPGARVRLRGADDQATVCATRLFPDAAEAARALRRAGDPAAALALLRDAPDLDAAGRAEAFLAARAAGEAPDPAWTAAARAALSSFDAAAAAADPDGGAGLAPGTRVRGVPLRVLRDFAFVRIDDWAGLADPGALPVLLPAGRYRVRAVPRDPAAAAAEPVWFDGQDGPLAEAPGAADGAREASLLLDRDGLLRTPLRRPDLAPAFRSLEVSWDPADRLVRAAGELRAALDALSEP